MIRIRSAASSLTAFPSDAAAIFLFQDVRLQKSQLASLTNALHTVIASAIALKDFSGKEGDLLPMYTGGSIKAPRILLVGLGESKSLTVEKIRRASARCARKAQELKLSTLAVQFPDLSLFPKAMQSPRMISQAMTEGSSLALYKFDKYVTPEKDRRMLEQMHFVIQKKRESTEIGAGIRTGSIIAEAVCHARDLENTPSSDLYPETLAQDAKTRAKKYGFSALVFNGRKIESLRMGGVIAVSKGSNRQPRFIVLEYGRRHKKRGTTVLIGKGVTFDSGGISIKAASGMAEMKMDMSGAAAVMGSVEAAARLALPVHLIGLIPAVENMPSGSALKPGDIIRHYNGKTSEVDNTDAEGRLILADALAYAVRYDPALVIDLATLTGACVVALGHIAAGILGTDQPSIDALRSAGDATFERVWQLPLYEEYEKLIKSEIADVKNAGGRWAGAITAACFLKKFVGTIPWVHIDIAGTAMLEEGTDYAPRGGSGFGIRLLTQYLMTKIKS